MEKKFGQHLHCYAVVRIGMLQAPEVEPRSRAKGKGLRDHGWGWASWAIHGLFKKLTDCKARPTNTPGFALRAMPPELKAALAGSGPNTIPHPNGSFRSMCGTREARQKQRH